MKQIEIDGKKYNIDCNALTYIDFRKKFNRGIFEDLKILENFTAKQVMLANNLKNKNKDITEPEIIASLSRIMLDDIDEYIEASTRIAYILIYTADNSILEYEEWLKGIKKISTNDKWIVEVTEFAVNCFC